MSSPELTISSNTTSNSSNDTNSPFAQRFDQRVSRQRRSTKAPMDFVYQSCKPQTYVSYHYQSSLPQTKPLRLIDLNGNKLINNHSSSSSWFKNHPPIQPQMSQSHKPNYSQVESMDWEPSPPTSVVENGSSDKDCRVMISTKERFLSKSMSSLPTIPTFTCPLAIDSGRGVTIVGDRGTNSPKSQTLLHLPRFVVDLSQKGNQFKPSYSTRMSTFVATLRYQGMLIHPQGLLRIASTKLDGEVGHCNQRLAEDLRCNYWSRYGEH
ncbi:hypothetical protein BY996DRAFT_6473356 [Phakopsora pachyrhizi]|nr:hypothetical protein BY996DRAFT_6473356 [Phakopsora pachyrhizi]